MNFPRVVEMIGDPYGPSTSLGNFVTGMLIYIRFGLTTAGRAGVCPTFSFVRFGEAKLHRSQGDCNMSERNHLAEAMASALAHIQAGQLKRAMNGALAIVEEETGGHWKRSQAYRIEISELGRLAGEWDESQHRVRISQDLFYGNTEDLYATFVHEAVHMLWPEWTENRVERVEEGIVARTLGLDQIEVEEPPAPIACRNCQQGWHDLCLDNESTAELCGCTECEVDPEVISDPSELI